jgi:hypothetical protein
MDARFTSMDASDGVFGGVVCARRAVTAVGSLAAAVGGAFSVCLSGMRRPQFDEEHQRSLLSCHMPDELVGGDSSFVNSNRGGYKPQPGPGAGPEAAMLELRRRVMMGDPAPPSRWKQRKMLAKQHRKPHDKQDEHRRTSSTGDATPAAESADMAALLSDTTLAIDELLGTSSRPAGDIHAGVRLEDVRRLSVDEQLALTPQAPETTGGNPETDGELDAEVLSKDGARLRAWLASIDSPRAGEYRAYAAMMERHGFQSLADLAQLDERDVETAMSEIGIAKFAHRLRIRKAIRELHLHTAPSPSVAPSPAAVAAA